MPLCKCVFLMLNYLPPSLDPQVACLYFMMAAAGHSARLWPDDRLRELELGYLPSSPSSVLQIMLASSCLATSPSLELATCTFFGLLVCVRRILIRRSVSPALRVPRCCGRCSFAIRMMPWTERPRPNKWEVALSILCSSHFEGFSRCRAA